MGAAQKSKPFVREATGLVRSLSSKDLVLTNLFSMGFIWPVIFLFFAGSIYQGVDLPVTVFLGFPIVVVIGLTLYLLSSTFPRAGGDYVWVSRIIHPAVGFMTNFVVALVWILAVGVLSEFFLIYGLGAMLTNLSIVTGNSAYASLAGIASNTSVILLVGVLFIAVAAVISLLGIKTTYRFMLVTFAVLAIGLLVYLAALLGAGPSGFQSGFNRLSGANYAAIISAANSAGFVTQFTLSGTLLGSVWTFLNFGGFSNSIYVAGEVKKNDRAQLYGIIGGLSIFTLTTLVIYGVSYYVIGGQFINAASLLAGSGNKAYTLAAVPTGIFLVIFANPSPLVAILVPLGVMAGTLGGTIVLFPIVTRMVFAWSFDRVVPTKLSEVTKRGVPKYSVLLVIFGGIVFVVATAYTTLSTFELYTFAGVWTDLAIVGIAAMVLPYRRKNLFENAPALAKKKVGRVPIISILGLITAVSGVGIAYASISPAITLTPLNAELLGVPVLMFVIGFAIYYVSFLYHKSRGLDLSLVFKEMPPE